MKIGAIIFSRMSSSRLPRKALLDINGKSLLGRVVDRASMIEGLDDIIIATSTDASDDIIEQFTISRKLKIFRGSLDNVLLRAIAACDYFNLDGFVRICGDRPFFDPGLTTKLLKKYRGLGCEILTTSSPKTLPAGLTIEILSQKLLIDISKKVSTDYDKEHLTSYIYKNPQNYEIRSYKSKRFEKYLDLNLSVDTFEQLEMASWIAKHSDKLDGSCASSQEVLNLARLWQDKENKNGNIRNS